MIFLEEHARFWLIVHGVVGVALVASATHLVIWARAAWRGQTTRWRATRRFALITVLLYLAAFVLGNLIYPTYKVRVRVEYFDEPTALRADAEARAEVRTLVEQRRTGSAEPPLRHDAPALTAVSRVFDVKEHWVALGLALAFAACALAWAWDPRRDGGGAGASALAGKALFLFAVGTAACAWTGALVGLYVSSFRSVGAL